MQLNRDSTYRPAVVKQRAAPGVLLMSDVMGAASSMNGVHAGTFSIAAAWDTEQLMELRSPLAAQRMNGEPALTERERELLIYLDLELDRRLHGAARQSELAVLIAQTQRLLVR
jgi:hypothetical protein